MAFLAGEMDAFDWVTRSLGMMTATTYPRDSKRDLLEIINALDAKRPTYKAGSISAFRERKKAWEERQAKAKAALKELNMTAREVRLKIKELKRKE